MQGRKVIWTLEMDVSLGTAIDKEIAERLGLSQSSVKYRREALGIPPRTKANWTPERDSLLGTMIDADAAKQLGLSVPTVRRRRVELGIPTCERRRINWTPEIVALLGTISDRQIARQFGIDNTAVSKYRSRSGISAYGAQPRVIPDKMSAYSNEAAQIYGRRRKHHKLGALNSLTYEQWRFACEWFHSCCAYCGKKAFLTEDHLVPLSEGGPRTVLNILPCCPTCNNSKRTQRAHSWICWKFGVVEGREIVKRIVAYLTEVRERWL